MDFDSMMPEAIQAVEASKWCLVVNNKVEQTSQRLDQSENRV
jgi:hypothetical protein